MAILSQEFVTAVLEQEKTGVKFPIELTQPVWEEIGYSRKDHAVRRIVKDLIENVDFITLPTSGENSEGRPETVYKLSTDGYDHFCMTARTSEGRQARKNFIAYKKAYLTSLERALNPTINPQIDATRFDYCFDAAIQVTAHRNKYDTQKRLLTYLDEGKDYCWDGATLWLSNPIYYSFIAASCTVKGIDVEKIGQTVVLDWQYYCRVCKALKSPKNAMFPRNRFKPVGKYKQLEIEV